MMGMNGSSEIAERVAMMEFGREDKPVLTSGCRIPIGEWMRVEPRPAERLR